MKISVKSDDYSLAKFCDWKRSYIADQLGITTENVSQLADGKAVEVKQSNIATCAAAITVLLREIKEAKPKGTDK